MHSINSSVLTRFFCKKRINSVLFHNQLGRREPTQPKIGVMPKDVPANEAFTNLKSEMTVFVAGGAATPTVLINAMTEYGKAQKLAGVKVCHMNLEGKVPFVDSSCENIFRSFSYFMGESVRNEVNEGSADIIPVFLSEVPKIMFNKVLDIDMALVHCSPPDKHGYCTLGTSADCVRAGVMCAKHVIAQINDKMCRTYGDTLIHISQIDVAVWCSEPLHEVSFEKADEAAKTIGRLIAENLIEDGSTLQMGIGNIPNAALEALNSHKDLGVHTEMFSDGLINLFIRGNVTNKYKYIHQGKSVVSFVVGTKRLYDFVHNNPFIEFLRVDYTNSSKIIAQQPKMVAINSCIEIDLTGQVVSDSIGTRMYSGFGGQVDFVKGTSEALDKKGKAIIAFPSMSKGRSKIVPFIKPGAGVVTTRAQVKYVVTEHGITNLFGKSFRQRAYELIRIADPSVRELLEKAAFNRLKVMPSP